MESRLFSAARFVVVHFEADLFCANFMQFVLIYKNYVFFSFFFYFVHKIPDFESYGVYYFIGRTLNIINKQKWK